MEDLEITVDLETTQPISPPPDYLVNFVKPEVVEMFIDLAIVYGNGGHDPYNHAGKFWRQECHKHECARRGSR